MRISLTFAAVSIVATVSAPASAQPSIDVTFGRALAPLAPYEESASRQTTAASIDVEHHVADERLRLFYSLDAGTYNTPGDWSYYLHTAGGSWRTSGPASTRPTLFVGGTASWRSNGASWAAADYRAAGAFANVEWRPRSTATLRAGYRLDARTFPDSPELDQREHGIFGSLLVSLPTRTTFIAEVRAGLKSYATGMDTRRAPTSTTDAPSIAPASPAAGASAGGSGRGMGGSYRATTQPVSAAGGMGVPTAGLDPARLVSVMGRVAQSVADRTGLSVQYTRRVSFGGLPTAIVATPALFFEDGIYDDPFASNAHALRGTVKQVFKGGAQLEGGGTRLLKDYRATPALAADGSVNAAAGMRADRIWRAGAAWTQPVLRSRTGAVGLDLIVDYWYTEHHSNDAFYNYSSHALGIGISVSY